MRDAELCGGRGRVARRRRRKKKVREVNGFSELGGLYWGGSNLLFVK